MQPGTGNPKRRHRLLSCASVGVTLLVLASPALVECGRQYDIHRAEVDYRRALRLAGTDWHTPGDWGQWYRTAAGDTPGATEFTRLCADARRFQAHADATLESFEAFGWVRGEHARLPSRHQREWIQWYLMESHTFVEQAEALLVHSQLLEPPAAETCGSYGRAAWAWHLTDLLNARVGLLLWTGEYDVAIRDLRILLQLPARLHPRLLKTDHALALSIAESALALCAHWMRLAPPVQLWRVGPELLQEPQLDEAGLLDCWSRHAAHVVAGRESDDVEWVRAFDLFGSYAWFGWVNPPMASQSRWDVFQHAGQSIRRDASDWRLLRANLDAIRAGLPVPSADACLPLWFARRTMTACALRAQQARALQRLRAAGSAPCIAPDTPDLEVVAGTGGSKLTLRVSLDARSEHRPFFASIKGHFPPVVIEDR